MTARHDTEARLEPCPFCGEPVRLVKSAIGCDWIEHVPRAGMPECGMEFSAFNLLGDLVEAWSTRALWQVIDTAPKDAMCLLLLDGIGDPRVGKWNKALDYWQDLHSCEPMPSPDCWCAIPPFQPPKLIHVWQDDQLTYHEDDELPDDGTDNE